MVFGWTGGECGSGVTTHAEEAPFSSVFQLLAGEEVVDKQAAAEFVLRVLLEGCDCWWEEGRVEVYGSGGEADQLSRFLGSIKTHRSLEGLTWSVKA